MNDFIIDIKRRIGCRAENEYMINVGSNLANAV